MWPISRLGVSDWSTQTSTHALVACWRSASATSTPPTAKLSDGSARSKRWTPTWTMRIEAARLCSSVPPYPTNDEVESRSGELSCPLQDLPMTGGGDRSLCRHGADIQARL